MARRSRRELGDGVIVVAIAGAVGGLGPHVARHFAAQGATLALGGRERLAEVAQDLAVPGEHHVRRRPPRRGRGARLGRRPRRALRPRRRAPAPRRRLARRPADRRGAARGLGGALDLLVRTVQHTSAGVPPAPDRLGERALRDHLGEGRAGADAHERRLRRGQGGRRGVDVRPRALLRGRGRAAARHRQRRGDQRARHARDARAEPDKAFATFTDAADIAAALAYLCSDAAEKMNGRRLVLHP